jgi:hypothetical protein
VGSQAAGSAAKGNVVGDETLSGTPVFTQSCVPPNVPAVFKLTGSASGPYNGTLTGSGSYQTTYMRRPTSLTSFEETFTITSGRRTINGTLIWNGQHVTADCSHGIVASSNFTYSATIKRDGVVVKTVSGSASEQGIFKAIYGETLNAL